MSEKTGVLFSTVVLHYIRQGLRPEILRNCKGFTSLSGLKVFSVFVKKPCIVRAPDGETTAQGWASGELYT